MLAPQSIRRRSRDGAPHHSLAAVPLVQFGVGYVYLAKEIIRTLQGAHTFIGPWEPAQISYRTYVRLV